MLTLKLVSEKLHVLNKIKHVIYKRVSLIKKIIFNISL